MRRKLAEIDLSSENISECLIRLACGHIFTVETLDGHCNMSEYYEIDLMGAFAATKAPPANYQTPPSCPTCHGPITALRYGRVTKRENLDILEQNVASEILSELKVHPMYVAAINVSNALCFVKVRCCSVISVKHFSYVFRVCKKLSPKQH